MKMIYIFILSISLSLVGCKHLFSEHTNEFASELHYLDEEKVCFTLIQRDSCHLKIVYSDLEGFDYFMFQDELRYLAYKNKSYDYLLNLIDYSNIFQQANQLPEISFRANNTENEVWVISTKKWKNVVFGFLVRPDSDSLLHELVHYQKSMTFMILYDANNHVSFASLKTLYD